jgi:multicomponent Na+:H+ antiporter subunit F
MIDQIQMFTNAVSVGLLTLLAVPLIMTIVRLLSGPGYADRFVALDMLTGIAVAMAALTSVITRRREFLDVAFGLALFGFVGTCALAAFLERKGVTRS